MDASEDCSGWKLPTLLPSSGWKLQRRTSNPSTRIHIHPPLTPSLNFPPPELPSMAPRTEFSTEQIRNKARKGLLYLLEGVCVASFPTAVPREPYSRPLRCCLSSHLALSRFAERRTSSLIEVSSAQSEL